MPALLFLRAHWRDVLLAVMGVALILACFVIRAVAAPAAPRIEVREVEKLVEVEKVVEKLVEVKVRDEDQVKTVVIYRDRLIHPDGTVQEHEEEHSVTDTDVHEETKAESVRVVEKEVVREVEKRVEVEAARPRWRAGGLVGVDFTRPPMFHPEGRVGFGAVVERRLIGPLSVGAWGLHTGPVGISATVEF